MIQQESRLKVADNSGARGSSMYPRAWRYTTPLRSRWRRNRLLGKKTLAQPVTLRKKSVVKAVVVRTRDQIHRKDGSTICFDDNAVVIINDDKQPKATRVFGPVPRELRDMGYMKIVSLAPEVL